MKRSIHLRSWTLHCLMLLLVAPAWGCPEDVAGSGESGDDLNAEGRPPIAVFLEPGTAIVENEETIGFEAVAVYSNGATATITDASTWSCTDPSVMEVSNDDGSKGMATAVSPGTSTMRVRTPSGLQAEAPIEVVQSREQIEDDVRNSLTVDLLPSVPTDMTLYAETANEVSFRATNMGDSYSVELENASGGVIEDHEDDNTFLLAPSADTMTFDAVVSNAQRTERFEGLSYASEEPPGPRIQLYDTRRAREIERGIDAGDITSIELNAIADSEFMASYPDDAPVRISDVTVTLDRDSGSPLVRSFSSGDIDLFDYRTAASPGDNLYIEIHEVQRRNYRGDVVVQNDFFPRSFYVPLK